MDGWEERLVYGTRRSEKRRAEEDLEFMREAWPRHDSVLARRKAVTAEARRLRQQVEHEVRVSVVARRLSQEQPQQQPSVGQQLQQMSVEQHPVEDDSDDSQSEWEPGEADDADVVYQWERFDDRGRPLELAASQQQNVDALPPIPEPRSPDEASLLLALQAATRCRRP